MAKTTALVVACGVVATSACQVYSDELLDDAARNQTEDTNPAVASGSSGGGSGSLRSPSAGGAPTFANSGAENGGAPIVAGSAGAADTGAAGASSAGASSEPPIISPTIFYVPHPGDDYLAMALGIAERISAGKHVKVILYTDGASALLRNIMNGRDEKGAPVNCPLYKSADPAHKDHPPNHGFDFTLSDIARLRQQEFERSMNALGVTDVEKTNYPDDAKDGEEYDPFTWKLKGLILENAKKYPGASHQCVSGPQDCSENGGAPAAAHIACWYAARLLMSEFPGGVAGHAWDFRFFDGYLYFNPDPSQWRATLNLELSYYLAAKQKSLALYQEWDPVNGRYALSYHALPVLFERAKSDVQAHIETIETHPSGFSCPTQK